MKDVNTLSVLPYIKIAPESCSYTVHRRTAVSCSSPPSVSACYVVGYGLAMVSSFVIASIFLQEYTLDRYNSSRDRGSFQTARLSR